MSNSYAVVSALIFAIVAIVHLVRIINQWPVVIGPYSVSMNVSWEALIVAVVLAIWGFAQLGVGPDDRDRGHIHTLLRVPMATGSSLHHNNNVDRFLR